MLASRMCTSARFVIFAAVAAAAPCRASHVVSIQYATPALMTCGFMIRNCVMLQLKSHCTLIRVQAPRRRRRSWTAGRPCSRNSSSWCRPARRARPRRRPRPRPPLAMAPAPRRRSQRRPSPPPPEDFSEDLSAGRCNANFGYSGQDMLPGPGSRQVSVVRTHKHCGRAGGYRWRQSGPPSPHPRGTLPIDDRVCAASVTSGADPVYNTLRARVGGLGLCNRLLSRRPAALWGLQRAGRGPATMGHAHLCVVLGRR